MIQLRLQVLNNVLRKRICVICNVICNQISERVLEKFQNGENLFALSSIRQVI